MIHETKIFLLYINDLPDDVTVILLSLLADDTTVFSMCDQASDLWQQLELAFELESDLRDVVEEKFLDEEKSSFRMLGLTFSSKLDWGSYIISIAKTAFKKIGALIHSMKFLLLRLLYISVNLSSAHVWNTVVKPELVLLVATWNF